MPPLPLFDGAKPGKRGGNLSFTPRSWRGKEEGRGGNCVCLSAPPLFFFEGGALLITCVWEKSVCVPLRAKRRAEPGIIRAQEEGD